MVGAEPDRVKLYLVPAVVLAVILGLCVGCFSRAYGRLAATHVEVLVAMARKGADLVVAGRLTAESMPELTYPLERAQAFAKRAAGGSTASRASLAAFQSLLARYAAFLDALDRVRRTGSGEPARAALAEPLTAVETAAAAVRAALRAEKQ